MAKKKVILKTDTEENHGGTVFSLCAEKSERWNDFVQMRWTNNGDNTFTSGNCTLRPFHENGLLKYSIVADDESVVFNSLKEVAQWQQGG